jgi:hypothetical protein
MITAAQADFLLVQFMPICEAMRAICTRAKRSLPALHVEDADSTAETYDSGPSTLGPSTLGFRRCDDLDIALALLAREDDRDYENTTNDEGLQAKLRKFRDAAVEADRAWFVAREHRQQNNLRVTGADPRLDRHIASLMEFYPPAIRHMEAVLAGRS